MAINECLNASLEVRTQEKKMVLSLSNTPQTIVKKKKKTNPRHLSNLILKSTECTYENK